MGTCNTVGTGGIDSLLVILIKYFRGTEREHHFGVFLPLSPSVRNFVCLNCEPIESKEEEGAATKMPPRHRRPSGLVGLLQLGGSRRGGGTFVGGGASCTTWAALLLIAAELCTAVEIAVSPSTRGGIQDALAGANPGDTVLLAGGVYTGSTSCGLVLNMSGVTLSGRTGERPIIDCTGLTRVAVVSAPDVAISNMDVRAGSFLLDPTWPAGGGSSYPQDLGGCFIVMIGGQRAALDSISMSGCERGAVVVVGVSGVKMTNLVINGSSGPGLIILEGGGAALSMSSISSSRTPSPHHSMIWDNACGGDTEASCLVANPIPAGTLCETAGMNATGNFSTGWYGDRLRQCPGSTSNICIVYEMLNMPETIGANYASHQAPGERRRQR